MASSQDDEETNANIDNDERDMSPDEILDELGRENCASIVVTTYPDVRDDVEFIPDEDGVNTDLCAKAMQRFSEEETMMRIGRLPLKMMLQMVYVCKTKRTLQIVLRAASNVNVIFAKKNE